MQRTFYGFVLLLALSPAHAVLLSRAGGQAYYDTDSDLTWVADANLAATNTFGALGILTDFQAGQMPWDVAQSWIAAMNTAGYLGKSDWRLPTVTDTDGPDPDALGNDGCDFAFTGTDCGWNVDLTTGEMAQMFSGTLSNVPGYDTSAVIQPCYTASPNYCLTDTGPFLNLQLSYWYGTEYAPDTLLAWGFSLATGSQFVPAKDNTFYGWPVRDGDIGDVLFDDADSDGVADAIDNCTQLANPTQCDSDGDDFGNYCDGDLNDNGTTNAQDYVLFRQQLGQPSTGPTYNEADINCNGAVNAQDYVLFRSRLGSPPGPSGSLP